VRDAVANGHPSFNRMWNGGGSANATRTARWLTGHAGEMRAELEATPSPQ
jgi:hypothetical protein